jgi:hypothetical protein
MTEYGGQPNIPTDLTLVQIDTIRQAVDIPLDISEATESKLGVVGLAYPLVE